MAVSSPDPATALVVAAAAVIAAGAALQVPCTLHPQPDDPSLLADAVFAAAGVAVLLSGAGLVLAAMSDQLWTAPAPPKYASGERHQPKAPVPPTPPVPTFRRVAHEWLAWKHDVAVEAPPACARSSSTPAPHATGSVMGSLPW